MKHINNLLKFDSRSQFAVFSRVVKSLPMLRKSTAEDFERPSFFGALAQREFQQTVKYGVMRVVMVAVMLVSGTVWAAEPPSPVMQAKIADYKKKLTVWAADPVIVVTVKEANIKERFPGMTNSKWLDVDEKGAEMQAILTSKASLLIKQWEQQDKNVNKLLLRDANANLVAGNIKPLLYNNKALPIYINAMKGEAWAAAEVKPDPTTQINSVQICAPVMDGDKVIGLIHMGLTVN